LSLPDGIRINEVLTLPRAELGFRATRAGGPGGQHVNTSATRIELTWNVRTSPSLSEEQRARLLEKLASRLDQDGQLRIVESRRRSQHANREAAIERFAALIATSLIVPRRRRRTRTPAKAREARLQRKKQRSEQKTLRRRPDTGE
jgi:ribosome-associated protein